MKRSKTPPEPLTLFVDNNLGSKLIPEALADIEWLTVVCGNVEFPEGTLDTEWIPIVGQRGWPVLTADKRIRQRQAEIEALVQARIHCFFITSKNLTGQDQAALVREQIDKVNRMVRLYEPPCLFSLSRSSVEPLDHVRVPVVRRSAVRRDSNQ